jgi:hypothetical protein
VSEVTFSAVELSDARFERDGLRVITVNSRALGRRGDVCVWAPPIGAASAPLPLLILLHGAERQRVVVAAARRRAPDRGAPDRRRGDRARRAGDAVRRAVGRRQRLRAARDADYERWIVDEVPAASRWPTTASPPASPLAIAGLSMGGFGALRLGPSTPTGSAASRRTRGDDARPPRRGDRDRLDGLPGFGQPDGTALHWLEANAARLPPLRFDCGTDDHLLPGNRALHAALDARGIEHQYEEFAGGHDWPYWRLHLADTLRFLDAPRPAPGRRPVGTPLPSVTSSPRAAPFSTCRRPRRSGDENAAVPRFRG